jgi:hypothetical protein
MRRREFIIGATTAIWPVAARAQQSGKPVIGELSSFSANARFDAGFRAGSGNLNRAISGVSA